MDPFPGVANLPGTLNKYAYVRNNPANATDPSGMFEGGLAGVMVSTGGQNQQRGMAATSIRYIRIAAKYFDKGVNYAIAAMMGFNYALALNLRGKGMWKFSRTIRISPGKWLCNHQSCLDLLSSNRRRKSASQPRTPAIKSSIAVLSAPLDVS